MTFKPQIGAFGKVLIKFTGSQVLYNGLRMVAGFLVVRMIAPEIYGAFSGVGVFLGYVLLGHFGIINGLGRDIPFELGKNNQLLVKRLASLGLWVSYLVGAIASFIFLLALLYQVLYGTQSDVIVYASYTIISFFYLLNKQFLPVLFRTNNEFDTLSKINIGMAFVNIASVSLVWGYGFYGLCLRAVLLICIEFILLYYYRPINVSPHWDTKLAISQIKTGLPIYAVGQVRPLWATVQNNLIFSMGGPLQFGYFALANIINGALGVIPNAISQVVYPKMSIQLGEGKSVAEILKKIIKPTIFLFLIIFSIGGVTYWLLPLIVPLLLPKYVGGVEVAQWSVFIPVVASLGLVNNIYNVVKKQKWYFISLLTGALSGLGYTIIMVLTEGFNLVYFPQGMLIGFFIQVVLSFAFLSKLKES